MARAALKWTTQELARRAGVGVNTVNRFEDNSDARLSSVSKIRLAFEGAGVVFHNERAVSLDGATVIAAPPENPSSRDDPENQKSSEPDRKASKKGD